MMLRLMVGLLVALATAAGLSALRLPFAPSVALASALGTVAGDAARARQARLPIRWSVALGQAIVIGAAVWVTLALLRG
jgi:hypothetical protein